MKNNSKVLSVIALAAAVVGLSLGFAAYTRTLTITPSATVAPTDTFTVAFDEVSTNSSCEVISGSSTNTAANKGTVSGTSISGVTATLFQPGDGIICTYKVNNTSSYIAYLNELHFADVISCAASTGSQATAGLVTAACAGVKATVQVGGNAFGPTGIYVTDTTAAVGSQTTIDNHSLAKTSGTENVYLKIWYESGSPVADGAFDVTIPQISLVYETTDRIS